MNFLKVNLKRFMAEAVGTFVLVVLSIAVHIFVVEGDPVMNTVTQSLVYIVGVVLLAYCIEHISGCHINPAVTVGAYLSREISGRRLVGHLISQLVGACVGGAAMLGILSFSPEHLHVPVVHSISHDLPYWIITEFVFVFIFVFLVIGAVGRFEHTKLGPLFVGITLIIEHFISVLIHGVYVNPAVAIASMFAYGGESYANIWLYLVVPLAAAVLAGLLARFYYAMGRKVPDDMQEYHDPHACHHCESHDGQHADDCEHKEHH